MAMTLSARLVTLTARTVVHRAARERRRALERELAAYSSPAERTDLFGMLTRYADDEVIELRLILEEQEPAPGRVRFAAAGMSRPRQ